MGGKEPLLHEIDENTASTLEKRGAFHATIFAAYDGDEDAKKQLCDSGEIFIVEKFDLMGVSEKKRVEWLESYVFAAYDGDPDGSSNFKDDAPAGAPLAMYGLAEIYFNQDPNDERVDGLLYDALVMELDRLQLSDNYLTSDQQFEKLEYLFGALHGKEHLSAFDRHVAERTMEALVEMQSDVSEKQDNAVSSGGDGLRRGFTSHANTYVTQASEKAELERKRMEMNSSKAYQLLRFMDDQLGYLGVQQDYE